jgi:hypothetical protein
MKHATRKGKAVKDSMLAVRLPEDLRASLERLAAEDRRTLSDLARLMLEDAVAARNSKTKGGKNA